MGPGGIYEIVNTVNGKRYVGSSINLDRRWKEHRKVLKRGKHHSVHLQRAWDKYGESAFVFLPMMSNPMFGDLIWWEQRFLNALLPEYNSSLATPAPMLGRKHSSKTKNMISTSLTGRVLSDTHRNNIAKAREGTKRSSDTKAKISRGNKGKIFSEEHRAKIGAVQKGKKAAPKTREKMSVSQTRRRAAERLAKEQEAKSCN